MWPYARRAYPSCGLSARFFAGFGTSSKVLNARCNSLHEGLDAWFGSLDELVEAKLEGPRARSKVGFSSLCYEGRAVLILLVCLQTLDQFAPACRIQMDLELLVVVIAWLFLFDDD